MKNSFDFSVNNQNKRRFWLKICAVLIGIVCLVVVLSKLPSEKTDDEEVSLEESVAGVIYEKEFFADYRQKREGWRGDESDLYHSIMDDDSVGAEDRSIASASYDQFLRRCILEDKVEKISIGRGYEDVKFFIEDNLSFLILQKDYLSEEERESLSTFRAGLRWDR